MIVTKCKGCGNGVVVAMPYITWLCRRCGEVNNPVVEVPERKPFGYRTWR